MNCGGLLGPPGQATGAWAGTPFTDRRVRASLAGRHPDLDLGTQTSQQSCKVSERRGLGGLLRTGLGCTSQGRELAARLTCRNGARAGGC